jgi:hypothetical protein
MQRVACIQAVGGLIAGEREAPVKEKKSRLALGTALNSLGLRANLCTTVTCLSPYNVTIGAIERFECNLTNTPSLIPADRKMRCASQAASMHGAKRNH